MYDDSSFSRTTGAEPPTVARKPNYNFEKRNKELARQAKKEAKREERQRRRQEGTAEPADESLPPSDQPPGRDPE